MINWRNSKGKVLVIALLLAGLGGIGYVTYQATQECSIRAPLYEFEEERDAVDILEIFDQDWYWLVADDDYSPEFMLKYRAPKQDPLYAGRMHIKVLREQDEFVGFVSYYMKTNTLGFLNFLAIKPEFRGKRYADQLMRYAIDDMKRMGATRIDLITRPSNTSAQKVYNRMGFVLTRQDGDYVSFSLSI